MYICVSIGGVFGFISLGNCLWYSEDKYLLDFYVVIVIIMEMNILWYLKIGENKE